MIAYYSTAHNQIKLISGSGAVALRFQYIEIVSLFHHVMRYLRTLYIVWSLVRRRATRRLTGLQTMHNVLKNSKTFQNGWGSVAVRLRLIFQFTYVQYCMSNSSQFEMPRL